ncbi:hypothetical protein HYG86_06165 [Alkalicella caledoniensis]|uniref:Uncharacterized protein n=1 Tax=Alkalicella caledoniensis TaxID=2731377 RepID=A0A7G9W6S2_ALKCA|nr:hypothetical protein [Alkalicella caledoniensis]QNO14384.1 hypothetical protein HYG86_06165 [Alkalicella caledoniensis]
MAILLAFFTFAIPIVGKKYYKIIQGVGAVIWLVLLISVNPSFPAEHLLNISLYFIPSWVLGSLFSLALLNEKYKNTNC